MKSLILAVICFGLVWLGIQGVEPYRAAKRVLKRTPSKPGTGRLRQAPAAPQEVPDSPVRRQPYR